MLGSSSSAPLREALYALAKLGSSCLTEHMSSTRLNSQGGQETAMLLTRRAEDRSKRAECARALTSIMAGEVLFSAQFAAPTGIFGRCRC